MIVASERQYKAAYSSLGDERTQKGTKGYVQISRRRRLKSKSAAVQDSLDAKDYEKFWFSRRDENWANMPMKKVYSRKERKMKYFSLVTEILIHLAPKSTFNPWLVWMQLKEKEAAQLNAEQASETTKTGTLSKLEMLRIGNTQQKIEDAQIAEITRIRNSKDSISTLIRHLSTQRAREILLIEILKKAVLDRNYTDIFDVLWAVENFELTKQDAPKPKKPSDIIPSVRDPSLVYDNYKNVENLLDEARKIRARETDIIRFQLNEMSDRLPPLSPYMFDFKLDAWQIRALQFIDAGKSLVICAPTSSGKTVLSTYVALITKHKFTATATVAISGDPNKADKSKKSSISKSVVENDVSVAVDTNDDEDIDNVMANFMNEEDDDDGEEEEEDEEEDDDEDEETNVASEAARRLGGITDDLTDEMIAADREKRIKFRKTNFDGVQRVLFVVPSEPLVWQVAAYFGKLLREEGEEESKVAIVTSQMMYYSSKKFNVMPQIVVGTPMALESALTKSRGLVGMWETVGKAQGDLLPGGFDHFDWAIFDEVHAIDGEEGDALQRLIRSMNCKFLALSATVGNAEELLGWMERVKGDQLVGVEALTVLPEEATFYGTGVNASQQSAATSGIAALASQATAAIDKKKKSGKAAAVAAAAIVYVQIKVIRRLDESAFTISNVSSQLTVLELKNKLWKLLPANEREPEACQLSLELNGQALNNDSASLESLGIAKDTTVHMNCFNVLVSRTVDNQNTLIKYVSPLCTLNSLRLRVIQSWPSFTAEALQVLMLEPLQSITTTTAATSTTKAINKGDLSIQVSPGVAFPKGSLVCLRSAASSDTGPQTSEKAAEIVEIVTVCQEKLSEDTVLKVYSVCHDFPAGTLCTGYSFKDLTVNSATLESYGLSKQTTPIVQVRSLVNLLSHQGRFINLQRFLWSNSKLVSMSPLAAVESLDDLKAGILDHSSLSFTSKDSYRLWLEMEKLYPTESIQKYNPHQFFTTTTRITLQSTKEYEDLLKSGLKELASLHPLETKELLFKFRIEDQTDKGVDLTDMCLSLRHESMLPCLAFHLNSFEAIALFKQLLAGIEWRQKKEHPMYYTDLIDEKEKLKKNQEKQQKDLGGNEKEAEEKAKSGEIEMSQDFSVDLYEPHPKFRFSKGSPMTADEFINLSDEMERFDGFEARDASAMQQGKGKNEAVLSHALMRGLRRGIALYIDEVSSPSYRRAVQRLASQGKLGVVISDNSLAFGVNMPFRTCIFCGEMEGRLTPLMAQQMSGRAGRRGLDTQGNLIYAGARASFIRSLMIGQIAQVTGAGYAPRYESLFLQGMLSSRHVGWSRVATLGGKSLDEYTRGLNITATSSAADATTAPSVSDVNHLLTGTNYGLHYSKHVMADLGLITLDAETGSWVPSEEWELLAMVWELRYNVIESVTLGRLLPALCEAIERKTIEVKKQMQAVGRDKVTGDYAKDKQESKDKNAKYVPFFYSILLQLIDRQPYNPLKTSLPPLHEHPQFNLDRPAERSVFLEWSKKFEIDQNDIPAHLVHMKSKVPPGTPLDSTLFYCVLDKEFVYTLTEEQKQDIKARIWHVGTTLKFMLNTLWPNNHYCEVMSGCIRTCFRHLYYLNTELIRGQTDFDDISSASKESKADKLLVESMEGFPMTSTAAPWKDTEACDLTQPKGVTYCEAMQRVVHRVKEWKAQNAAPTAAQTSEVLSRTVSAFSALRADKDMTFVRLAALEFKDADVPLAVASASASLQSPKHLIGLVLWMCLKLIPTLQPKFPVYLKALIDYEKQDLLEESAVQEWAQASAEQCLESLPVGHQVTVEDITKVKSSNTMVAFLKWLEASADDEEDDDEEEDEED